MAIDYSGFKFDKASQARKPAKVPVAKAGLAKTGKTPKDLRAKRNREGRTVAATDRGNVFDRQRFQCYAYGISPVCTVRVHHPHELIPVSKGGPRESWNRVGICSSCHAATDSTLGGRRLFFDWPGKADGKKPNADKHGNVTAIWKDRRTRKTAPGPSTGVLPQDDGAGRPITQPGQVAPVESSAEGKNP